MHGLPLQHQPVMQLRPGCLATPLALPSLGYQPCRHALRSPARLRRCTIVAAEQKEETGKSEGARAVLHVCNRHFTWATSLTRLCSACTGSGAAEGFQRAGEAVNKAVQQGVANVKEAFDIIDDNVLDYCNLDPAVSARRCMCTVRKPLQHLPCWWPCDVMQLLPHIHAEAAVPADAWPAGQTPKGPDELGREGGTVHGCPAGKSTAVCSLCPSAKAHDKQQLHGIAGCPVSAVSTWVA